VRQEKGSGGWHEAAAWPRPRGDTVYKCRFRLLRRALQVTGMLLSHFATLCAGLFAVTAPVAGAAGPSGMPGLGRDTPEPTSAKAHLLSIQV